MKFTILTLGCKVNLYESEGIINNLKSHGLEYVDNSEKNVDLFILNSCTVTSVADQKSRQMLHLARRNNPFACICCMGCYSQLNDKEALNDADIVLGTTNKLQVYDAFIKYLENNNKISYVTDSRLNPCFEEMNVENFETHTRAFIKIQDGCNNFCSYCCIPYARGSIRSRSSDAIIDEINRLINKGVKEVIFSGINTGTYGKDLNNISLASLIEKVMINTSLYRLRLSSIELSEITDELLDILKNYSSRIAHHLHIPLQAGSNSVLKRMNRHYTLEEYLSIVKKIREIYPDVALTTDILAGFVGETIDEFNECLDFIDKVNFYEMHVFPYSKRKNTKAYDMVGHLDKKTKQLRAKEISQHASIMKLSYMKSFINKEVDVICESIKDGYYHGKSSNYLDISFKSDILLSGKIVYLKITELVDDKLFGKVINYE